MSELRYKTYSGPDDIQSFTMKYKKSERYCGIGWYFEESHEPTLDDWARVLNMESNAWYRQFSENGKTRILLATIAVKSDIILRDYC